MAFVVSIFFLSLCLVINVAFQRQCGDENKEKAIAPRTKRAANSAIFDLEKNIFNKLTRKYKNEDKILEWVCMNGSNPEFAGKEELTKSMVTVDARNVKSGEPTRPTEKISGLFQNLYCNSQQMSLSSTIKQTIKRNSSFTYRAEKGLKRFNKDGIPIVLTLPASLQRENAPVDKLTINLMGKKSDANTVTDIHELFHNVTVPPLKAKMVYITLVHKVVNVEYNAELVLTGAVVAKFKKGKEGAPEYASHQLIEFADSNYVLEGDSLVFETKGKFTGSRAFNVSVKEEETTVDKEECKHEELQSKGDFRIIHMKPTAPITEDLTSRK